MLRAGLNNCKGLNLVCIQGDIPDCLAQSIDPETVSISSLNQLALTLSKMDEVSLATFEAAAAYVKPRGMEQWEHLAENIELFDFVPGVQTPAEYGKYVIMESGRFASDEKLDAFYDFEKYGSQQIEKESGGFVEQGYVGDLGGGSMAELMQTGQTETTEPTNGMTEYEKGESQGMQMGDIQ